jgi:hypothetical protein
MVVPTPPNWNCPPRLYDPKLSVDRFRRSPRLLKSVFP